MERMRGKHRVAPHQKTQSGLKGPAAAVKTTTFDFDESHPAFAWRHSDRTKDQEAEIERERIALMQRAARKAEASDR